MKPIEEIKDILLTSTNNEPKIGFIESDKFFMPINWNSFFDIFCGIFYFSLPILGLIIFISKSIDFYLILCLIGFGLLALVLYIFYRLFVYNYLVFDYNNNRFYTASKLFNRFEFGRTSFIEVKDIRKIALNTFFVNDHTGLYKKEILDRMCFILRDNSHYWVDGYFKYRQIHKRLFKRCTLLSECIQKKFEYFGDEEEIRAMIEAQNDRRGCLLMFTFGLFIAVIAFILQYLLY